MRLIAVASIIGIIISFLIIVDAYRQPLLIVSLNGFSPSYFKKPLKNFAEFREKGVTAAFLRSVMPSGTFPNHVTIATGLYPENHGVLAQTVFDSSLGKDLKYGRDLFSYNRQSVLPIYIENQLNDGHSACIMWPGADFEYTHKRIKCSHIQEFDKELGWSDHVQKAVGWIKDPQKPANLVMLYIAQPDDETHKYGKKKEESQYMLDLVDNIVGYIDDKLSENDLKQHVNVIYLSDHGMESTIGVNMIDLESFLPPNSAKIYGQSPVLQVVPKMGKEKAVWVKLSEAARLNGNFNVYTCATLPREWRLCNPQSKKGRFGPIFAIAKPKFAFLDLKKKLMKQEKKDGIIYNLHTEYGIHGYDNNISRHGIFMARGPLFQENVKVPGFDNVDLHYLFRRAIGSRIRTTLDGKDNVALWKMMFKNENNF